MLCNNDNKNNFLSILTKILMLLFLFVGRTVRVNLPQGSDYNQFLRIAVGSAFDWVYYENPSFVRLSVIPSSKW